jgi:hypothetical protein
LARSPRNRLLRVFAIGVGVMFLPIVFAIVVKTFVLAAHPAGWLLGVVVGVAALVLIEALGLWMREVGREEREWIATGYQLRPPARSAPSARRAPSAGSAPSARRAPSAGSAPSARRAPTAPPAPSAGVVPSADAAASAGVTATTEPRRRIGGSGRLATSLGRRGLLIVLPVMVVALLAIPVTIAGAVWHVRCLVIVGIVMLVFLLILNALLLPVMRMRAGPRSSLA